MDELSQQISEALNELEPQVTSPDPNERKLARRLRIERRLEALRRQNEPEQKDIEEKKDKSLTQTQIEKSIEVLKKLLAEGEERITNVRVANDSRETDRREAEGVNKEKIIEALEEEAQLAEQAFQQISEKWFSILKSNDPLHINEKLLFQKEKCEELIRQKDGIIAMLKEEIAEAEKKYSNDQKKQMDDICILSNRIEKQITLTRIAYREQLKLIEESMQAERRVMIEMNAKKWEELYKKRDQEEQANSEKKYNQMEEFDNKMIELRREFQEKYRETKINLERDINELEQELERIRALALLNSEKLDYNYQILKKREDENIIIKSQQKRRINKLQDIVNTLKRKISEYGEGTKQQITKVSAEIAKLQKNIMDIESKADHFAEINDAKFNQLWDMNMGRVLEVVERILTIDKILHEQLLGLEWIDKGVLSRKELKKESLPSYKHALEVLKEEANAQTPQVDISFIKNRKPISCDDKKKSSRENLLRQVMKQISDCTGFILEDRLQLILEPFMETETTLIKMDNVFSALNITKDDDIDQLLEYFLPYTHCPVCSSHPSTGESLKPGDSVVVVHQATRKLELDVESEVIGAGLIHGLEEGRRGVQDKTGYLHLPLAHLPDPTVTLVMSEVLDVSSTQGSESVESLEEEEEEDEQQPVTYETLNPLDNMPPLTPGSSQQKDSNAINLKMEHNEMENKLSCQFQHPLVISSVYVLKALRNFVNNYYKPKLGPPTMEKRLSRQRNTICRLVEENDIKIFWEQFKNIFTEDDENVWNALSEGLNRYHNVLKDRKMLNDEVVLLRQQNQDLKLLLAKYLDDTDNFGLEPPCAVNTPPGTRSRKL